MTTTAATEPAIRPGIIVDPVCRLEPARIQAIHRASMTILDDPGILCFNEPAADLFRSKGCAVTRAERDNAWVLRIPERVIMDAVEAAPSRVLLGARNPANQLELDAEVPRVYFGTGAETNVFLETQMIEYEPRDGSGPIAELPQYEAKRGSVQRLCDSARLCNALEHIDFFIRNVNIQDQGITASNKDVNVFLASLMYMTKHVQAGIANLPSLDPVIRLAELVAGGDAALRDNPLISFIACVVKSPLQMVEDTADKVMAIAERAFPLVISSSPQGGSTAPIQEEGMTALINAEILAGITLAELVNPGAPVLYGAVPVRARLDNLHDLYGAPEFIHYNMDCVQMARHYKLPCYSTAGVGDAKTPGMQATVEKLLSHLALAQSGAQYIHYAFGLLDRTSVFCPAQAVIDNANVGMVKQIIRQPCFDAGNAATAVAEIRKVMASSSRLFARQIRKYRRRGLVTPPYPLEGDGDAVLANACAEVERIRQTSGEPLSEAVMAQIQEHIPGVLPAQAFQLGGDIDGRQRTAR